MIQSKINYYDTPKTIKLSPEKISIFTKIALRMLAELVNGTYEPSAFKRSFRSDEIENVTNQLNYLLEMSDIQFSSEDEFRNYCIKMGSVLIGGPDPIINHLKAIDDQIKKIQDLKSVDEKEKIKELKRMRKKLKQTKKEELRKTSKMVESVFRKDAEDNPFDDSCISFDFSSKKVTVNRERIEEVLRIKQALQQNHIRAVRETYTNYT